VDPLPKLASAQPDPTRQKTNEPMSDQLIGREGKPWTPFQMVCGALDATQMFSAQAR
jgi:hypothetical protein